MKKIALTKSVKEAIRLKQALEDYRKLCCKAIQGKL